MKDGLMATERSVHTRADGGTYVCVEHRRTDPYEELANSCKFGARGYDQRLKALAVFDHLDPADVWPAWQAIADAVVWGWQDARAVNGLRQKAANIACGSDINQWVDRVAVSRGLTAAADALDGR
jgi:hypothetical protein